MNEDFSKYRLAVIGQIRTMFERMLEEGRFEALKEIMEGEDRFNLSQTTDATLSRIHARMEAALQSSQPAPENSEKP
jgi:hypothetical protein